MAKHKYSAGFTLIELMIAVAIIALLAGIAIPAYNEYVRESQLGAARMNAEPLRLALEDHWLDNQSYAAFNGKKWDPKAGVDTLFKDVGWRPDGDNDAFNYAVTGNATSYTITVTHLGSGRTISCTKQDKCK